MARSGVCFDLPELLLAPASSGPIAFANFFHSQPLRAPTYQPRWFRVQAVTLATYPARMDAMTSVAIFQSASDSFA